MSRYRSYDDWLDEQTELYVKPIESEEKELALNWDQLKVRDYSPGSFSSGGLVVRGTPPVKKEVDTGLPATTRKTTSVFDNNPIFDFVGNVLWGFGESFVIPTVMDVAAEGDLSAAFGHQAWKDESWAGRIGYMLGTAGGMLTGIGLVGKGISAGSKVLGAGTKLATKKGLTKLTSHGFKEASEETLKKVVVKSRNIIQKGTASEIKKLNWATRLNPLATARASISHNPLSNKVINDKVRNTVTDSLSKITKLAPGSPVLNEIVETVMKASGESLKQHMGHSLAYTLTMRLGVNAKVAKVAGDVFYEALLLGAWDSIIGFAGDSQARALGLIEGEQWNYETFFHRATHGMMVGSILAPIRYIPGGKEVAFGKSGMIADMSSIGKIIRNRFRNVDKMSHGELLGFANSITISAGSSLADDIFIGVKGFSEAWLKNLRPKKLLASDVDILKNMFRTIKGQMPQIAGTLSGEIFKDGIHSFSRASIGSFAMNFSAYKDVIDSGIWNTEDYPLSKFFADHFVGMVYMKRGKAFGDYKAKPKKFGEGMFKERELLETQKVNLFGHTPAKRFYQESGFEMNGTEISRLMDAMNILNKSKAELDIYNTVAHLNTAQALNTLKAQNLDTTVDAKAIIELVRQRFVEPVENQKRVDADYAENVINKKGEAVLQSWEYHTKRELDRLNDVFLDLQKKGDQDGAQKVRKLADELMESINIVQRVQEYAYRGYDGKILASMTLAESLDFVKEFQNIKLPSSGQKLTWENFSIFEEEVMKSDIKVEADVENMTLEYISKSLSKIGMADANSVINGKLHVHRDISEALRILKEFVDPSTNTRTYKDAAITLENALIMGDTAGIIKIGDQGIKLDRTEFMKRADLNEFVSEYTISTENAHEFVFNSGPGRESSWREKITGWDKKPGFLDYKILGQAPFWNSIQAAHRYRRNEQAYYSFTGGKHNESSKKLYDYLQEKLEGNVNFRVVDQILDKLEMKDFIFTAENRETAVFLNQLNNMLELTNLKGSSLVSKKVVDMGELEAIKDEIVKNVGNIFTSPEEYMGFKKLVYQKFINELTGNASISNGLKLAITDLMSMNDNLLSMKHGGRLNIRSSEGLRKTLLGDPNLAPNSAEHTMIEQLIIDYVKEFENPLLLATEGKGKSINFIDDKLSIGVDDAFTRADLIQHVRRIVSTSTQIGSTELTGVMRQLNSLNIAIKEFDLNIASTNQASIDIGGQANARLVEAFDFLRSESVDLGRLLDKLITDKNAVALRSFIDNSGKLEDLTYKMLSSNGINTKRLKDFTLTLQEYVKKSLEEHQLLLRIDTVQDANDYVAEAVKSISHTDLSGRPISNDVTLSSQQYSKKWFLSEDYVETLIYNPKKLLDAAGIVSPPMHTNLYKMMNQGLTGAVLGHFSVKDYIDIVVEPLVKSKKIHIDLNAQLDIKDPLRKDYGTYEEFYTDTYHIIQKALGSKKMAMGIYENGVLKVELTSVSTWNTGVNRLASFLGLNTDIGEIMLLGNRYGTGNGYSTKMTEKVRAQLEADLADGRPTDLNVLEVLRDSDMKMFDTFSNLIQGDGRDASTRYILAQLDEKQAILIPKSSKDKIIQTYADPKSPLRQYLSTIMAASITSESGGKIRLTKTEVETKVQNFLKEYIPEANFDKTTGIMDKIVPTNQQTKDLISIARLASAMEFDLMRVINRQETIAESLSTLKYIKLDSSKNGTAMTKLNLEFAKDYFPRFMGSKDKVQTAYKMFLDQTFDSQGRIKERRDLNIFDESGKGDTGNYFSSTEIARIKYKKQLRRNNPEITDKDLNDLIETELMQPHYDKVPASVVNGHKFLSLPAMVQVLVARGARNDWFIWDGADIIGFNVAVKPVEFHSRVDTNTGSMEVHIGKTAYTWNPAMDKYMQKTVYKDGKYQKEYYIDAIGFGSTHKQHMKYNPTSGLLEKPGLSLSSKNRSENFISDMVINQTDASRQIFNIPLESILIKSIAGKKDATISAGFGNLMSNKALGELNSVTRMADVYNDMYTRFADMAVNPFSYQVITEKLLFGQKRTGDMIGEVTGIEQVLKVDGLPLFEFMMPSIDKMVVSEYMGTRNSITSTMKTGSYGVMVPAEGFSNPVRREGVQYQFGGSGLSSKEWQQPLSDIVSLRSLNGEAAFKVKGNESLTFIFKMNKEWLIEHNFDLKLYGKDFIGSDFGIVMDGGKAVIIGPHLGVKWSGENKKSFERLKEIIKNDYETTLKHVNDDPSITTVGDLALHLNGTKEEFTTSYKDYNLTAHSNNKDTHNGEASYNLITGTKSGAKDKPLYSQIHLGKVDLRQPKPGLNDWVITRIERLSDERKGPITEINSLDAIDPQDADFDLDRSASMYALPGEVVKEIYHTSGYAQITEEVFEQAKIDVGIVSDAAKHKDALGEIDAHKAPLMRQTSILSTLLQYFSERPETGKDLFEPGWNKGLGNESKSRFNLGPKSGFTTKDGYRYEFALRDNYKLVGSLGYMKSLIKAVVDMYKTPQNVGKKSLPELIWTDATHGFIEITEFRPHDKKGRSITYNDMQAGGQAIFNRLKNEVLEPLGQLHNLGLMTEHFGDGTSRKMSSFELVHKFEQIIYKIKNAGYDKVESKITPGEFKYKENNLFVLTEPLTRFLGYGNKKNTLSESNLPLIKGLTSLRQAQNKVFGQLPSLDSGLGQLLLSTSKSIDSKLVDRAINEILYDQTLSAQISMANYKYEQINDIYNELLYKGKGNSKVAQYWGRELAKYEKVIANYNQKINDPKVIYEQNRTQIQKNGGKGRLSEIDHVAIYREIKKDGKGEVKLVDIVDPGKEVYWKKGDLLWFNPKRVVAGNKFTQNARAAMHDAFARKDARLESSDYEYLKRLTQSFESELRSDKNNLIDPNRPKDSQRWKINNEKELGILMDFLEQAHQYSPSQGTVMQQQFLHLLLTPRVDNTVFSMNGIHSVTGKVIKDFHYKPNKYNEKLIFSFLDRAQKGNALATMDVVQAKEMYKLINDRFKAAFIKQYDPLLKGDYFDFGRLERDWSDFSLLPPVKNLPQFIFQKDINRQAQSIGKSYITGTYYLNPRDLYRLTVGMIGTLEQLPSATSISQSIEMLWEGTDMKSYQGGNIYEPKHSFRTKVYHSAEPEKTNLREFFERLEGECFN